MTAWSDTGFVIHDKGLPTYLPALLEEWTHMISRYCRVTRGEDTPYHHSERVDLGVLAAAAWRVGLISLEEFPARRHLGSNYGVGRADLWVRAEDAEDGDAFEAKFEVVRSDNASAAAETGSVKLVRMFNV